MRRWLMHSTRARSPLLLAMAALVALSAACGGGKSEGGGGPGAPSNGCATAAAGTGAPVAGSLTVNGAARTYQLVVPAGDPRTARALVLVFHGKGGDGLGYRNWIGKQIEAAARDEAVFVYPDGVDDGKGWPNQDGKDVAFVDALLAKLATEVCYDQKRVFATGFSYGGYMSNTLGCARGTAIRAIAPVAGGGPWGTCTGPVAAWIAHGLNDTPATGEASRDRWLKENGCGAGSHAITPSPCVAYDGCGSDPVIWCAFDGEHTVPSFAPAAIWSFFDSLP